MTDDEAVYDDFYDDDFCLTNGLVGEALAIPSASPKNFFQAISDTDAMPRQNLWGKLFLPDGAGRSSGAGGAGQPGQPGGAGQPGRSGGAGQSGRSGQPSRLDEPGPYPVVIIAPGSLGLQEHHLSYAAELTDAAIAACAIDPSATGASSAPSRIKPSIRLRPAPGTCLRRLSCLRPGLRLTQPASARKATAGAVRRC